MHTNSPDSICTPVARSKVSALALAHIAARCTVLCSFTVLGLLMSMSGCHRGTGSPTSASYAEIASAFTIGTIALETGDRKGRDGEFLRKVTALAPDEPAGWANLGLMELRLIKLPEASADLAKAQALAPNNPGIEKMLARLADLKGDLGGAVAHAQAAVRLAPDDIRARYALAEELIRQNTPEGDTAYQQQIEAILQTQPGNLLAELSLVTVAAKRADKIALAKAVEMLQVMAPTFSPLAAGYFNQLKKAAAGEDIRTTSITARILQNTLKTNVNYKPGFDALTRDPKSGMGDPLFQFIKLPPISSKPDVADTTTKFSAQSLNEKGTWVGAIWLDDTGKQVIATADSKSVHLPDGQSLAFPGAAGKAPGPHSILGLDVNYDLKVDLVFAGPVGIKLYIQSKDGKFVDSTASMKLPLAVTTAAYVGAWAMDIESDGDLDIVLGTPKGEPVVLRNNGDGTWLATHPFKGMDGLRDFVAADVDGDGNPDVAVLDAASTLHVFMNQRSGLFKSRSVPTALGKISALTAADLHADGRLSFIVLDRNGAIVRLSDKSRGIDWDMSEIARWSPLPKDLAGSARLLIADLDNNGALDIVASTESQTQVWLAGADYSYTPLQSGFVGSVSSLAKPATGGLTDLVGIAANGDLVRLVNSGTKSYNWQEVRPRPWPSEFNKGKGDRRVNSFGIGGEIEARAALLYERMPMDAPSIHFGLGSHAVLDAVRILWPNGDIRGEFADTLKPDQTVELVHRLEESCPFLFTWNGKRMEFVTDCIWRSPLGLKINAQDTAGVAMTQDWVKIRGDQLVPDKDGQYDLRITAELNETHFFDHLSLMTVDHPVGTDIFVDERFAIPPPPLAVHLTTPLEPIKRAVDDNGADVTETVRARDAVYLDTFGRGDYQGVTRDHWVEIELDEKPGVPTPRWLVCYGFIYPTNSSINVALGQGHAAPPRGLSIDTPDAHGHWSVARAGLGFPEGKVKTILIDLTGVFKPGAPLKLRLRTNLEIYWDAIQCAQDLPANSVRTTRLAAAEASLDYRGFSEIVAANNSSPGLPVSYEKLLSVGPQWRDLEGYYTRYGDVRELLASVDDRYVIMNAGDELRLRFNAPPAPKFGFVRDYVLIGDGWVKDGDYNTTFSKTVLPLPQHSSSDYSVRPGNLEDDPVYRKHSKDWEVYHTRYVWPAAGVQLRPGG